MAPKIKVNRRNVTNVDAVRFDGSNGTECGLTQLTESALEEFGPCGFGLSWCFVDAEGRHIFPMPGYWIIGEGVHREVLSPEEFNRRYAAS